MDKGKKQKKNAAAAPPPPQKKIKKPLRKKGKAPVSSVAPSAPSKISPSKAPSQISPSNAPPALPAPSAPAKVPPAKQNGVKPATAEGNKGGSGQLVAGYIFFCNGKTKAECYQNRVFGLPRGRMQDVQKIKKGAKLFLFDYDLKLLYGVYKAVSDGGLNLEASAFNGNFPAQVKFRVFKDCYPIPEPSLKQVIKDNYNGRGRFNPELNSEQVKNLLSLFQPISNKLQSAMPHPVEERRAPLRQEERSITGGPRYASGVPHVQSDPYASAPHVTRAPPLMDPYVDPYASLAHVTRAPLLLDPHVQNDPYASAAHITRAPILLDAGLAPAGRLPPPAGAYHPVAVGLPPSNDVYHPTAASVHQTDSQAYYPQTSVLLERYRAVPQIMLPNEPPPAPARDYRYINARENEVAPRMELPSQYYSTGRAVASAGELPQQNSWAPGYENLNRVYADDLHRSVSSRAMANLPVSSLYSFAGAAPYR